MNRIKLGDHLKLCDVADVTKVAACGSVANGRLGRVGEIVLRREGCICRL